MRSRRHRWASLAGAVGLAVVLGFVIAVGSSVYERGWSVTAASLRSVASDLRETSSETAVSARVRTALALSNRVSVFDIGVDTERGVVTLTGEVSGDSDRNLAGLITESVVGEAGEAMDVRNLIVVNPALTRDVEHDALAGRIRDLEAQVAAADALRRSPTLRPNDIRVRVADGVATLDGSVASPDEITLAGTLVRDINGVDSLENNLEVDQK